MDTEFVIRLDTEFDILSEMEFDIQPDTIFEKGKIRQKIGYLAEYPALESKYSVHPY